MTIFTQTRVRQSALEEYKSPLADVLGATVDDAITYGPTSSLLRMDELGEAEQGRAQIVGRGVIRRPPATLMLDAETARKRVKDEALDLTIPDEGIRSGALDILVERKKEERRRQDILSRAPTGFGATAARIGTALAASALDPLNVASAFIPIVGEARYAAMLGRAGGAIGRAGVRARVGALEGAVGAALVEPIVYGAARQEQADYDLNDSLLNIGLGTALGGGLHVGIGAAADAMNRGLNWRQVRANLAEAVPSILQDAGFDARRSALMAGISQGVTGRAINIEPVISHAANMSERFAEMPLRAAVGQDFITPTVRVDEVDPPLRTSGMAEALAPETGIVLPDRAALEAQMVAAFNREMPSIEQQFNDWGHDRALKKSAAHEVWDRDQAEELFGDWEDVPDDLRAIIEQHGSAVRISDGEGDMRFFPPDAAPSREDWMRAIIEEGGGIMPARTLSDIIPTSANAALGYANGARAAVEVAASALGWTPDGRGSYRYFTIGKGDRHLSIRISDHARTSRHHDNPDINLSPGGDTIDDLIAKLQEGEVRGGSLVARSGSSEEELRLGKPRPSLDAQPVARPTAQDETSTSSPALSTALLKRPESLQAVAQASFAPEALRLYDEPAIHASDERLASAPSDEAMPDASLSEVMEDLERLVAALDARPVSRAKPFKPGLPPDPEKKMQARPALAMLKQAGGVNPDSPLGGELRAMGVTAKNTPGLFRRTGRGAADNFVRSEHPIFASVGGEDDLNAYIDEGEILEAIQDELFGSPRRSPEELEAIERYRQTVEAVAMQGVVREEIEGFAEFLDSMPSPRSEDDYGTYEAMVARELAEFNELADTADAYGRAVSAAAECQLRRGS